MSKLKQEFGAAVIALGKKYEISSQLLFDLSWHLDNRLNPPQEDMKEE